MNKVLSIVWLNEVKGNLSNGHTEGISHLKSKLILSDVPWPPRSSFNSVTLPVCYTRG